MAEHLSNYYNKERIARRVSENEHRSAIGGMWDEIGTLQLEFLKSPFQKELCDFSDL
jgi:hypothetical protein